MTPVSTSLRVTVRYFAAARAAAGSDAETLSIEPGTSVAALVETLARRNAKLAGVLSRCSYLCDGVAVRDRAMRLEHDGRGTGPTIDVLPPFAGG
jgi:sulfur-carrier protein